MERKHQIFVVLALLAVAIAAVIVVLWPRNVATIQCADGSLLKIREVTFGTRHRSLSEPHWPPQISSSSQLRRTWETICDLFRPPAKRVRKVVPFFFNSDVPALALWGSWHRQGPQRHAFKFVLVDESDVPIAPLTPRTSFSASPARYGLFATTTNLPPTRIVRIQVFDDAFEEGKTPVGRFAFKNKLANDSLSR